MPGSGPLMNLHFYEQAMTPGSRLCASAGNCNPDGPLYGTKWTQPLGLQDVELRTKPLSNATAFRITLNTMRKPSLVATTIALGNSSAPKEFPHGANATAPAVAASVAAGYARSVVYSRKAAVRQS